MVQHTRRVVVWVDNNPSHLRERFKCESLCREHGLVVLDWLSPFAANELLRTSAHVVRCVVASSGPLLHMGLAVPEGVPLFVNSAAARRDPNQQQLCEAKGATVLRDVKVRDAVLAAFGPLPPPQPGHREDPAVVREEVVGMVAEHEGCSEEQAAALLGEHELAFVRAAHGDLGLANTLRALSTQASRVQLALTRPHSPVVEGAAARDDPDFAAHRRFLFQAMARNGVSEEALQTLLDPRFDAKYPLDVADVVAMHMHRPQLFAGGWCRFGLSVTKLAHRPLENSFVRAFHGTTEENAAKILGSGALLTREHVPEIVARPGHVASGKIFVSPSPVYASNHVYARPVEWEHDGQTLHAQLMFEVRVSPSLHCMRNTLPESAWPKDVLFEPVLGDNLVELWTPASRLVQVVGILVRLSATPPSVLERDLAARRRAHGMVVDPSLPPHAPVEVPEGFGARTPLERVSAKRNSVFKKGDLVVCVENNVTGRVRGMEVVDGEYQYKVFMLGRQEYWNLKEDAIRRPRDSEGEGEGDS